MTTQDVVLDVDTTVKLSGLHRSPRPGRRNSLCGSGLAADRSAAVSAAAEANPNTPVGFLPGLSRDLSARVQASALANPSCSPDCLR